MILTWIVHNIEWVIGVIGMIITWFTGRKLQTLNVRSKEKDVQSDSIRVATENVEFYQKIMDDLKNRFEETLNEYKEDQDKFKILLQESRELISHQEKYIKRQKLYISKLEGILTKNKIKFNRDENREEN